MNSRALHSYLFLLFFFYSFVTWAQPGQDCVDAEVICSDGDIAFNPLGIGIDDFADPDNDAGCMSSDENQSAWYYFEFLPTMPPNSIIEFTINPNGGAGQDYDFAIFGPNVECDDLGSPIRCSYASAACAFCPQTGLGMGTTDVSEAPGGDGFVSGLQVQPGQGFYLLLDNFLGTSTGFTMDWGGDAAPFLNCNATPGCELVLTVGPDIEQCVNEGSFSLTSMISGNIDPVTYSWTAVDGMGNNVTNYIVDPTSPNPTVNLPPDFDGTIIFTLVAAEPTCMRTETMNFASFPGIDIEGEDFSFCDGGTAILSVPNGFQSYVWSTGVGTSSVVADDTGTYMVTVTDNNGCQASTSFNVVEYPVLNPQIAGDDQVCFGNSATFGLLDQYVGYAWSTGGFTQSITVTEPGLYAVTVFDNNGCVAEAFWTVTDLPEPNFIINGLTEVCPNGTVELMVSAIFDTYLWSNGQTGQSATISMPGTYDVTVFDANGCAGIREIIIVAAAIPEPIILGSTLLCVGDYQILEVINTNPTNPFTGFLWSDGSTASSLQISSGGTYSVAITGINGCEGSTDITIHENIPTVTIVGDAEFCEGNSAVLQTDNTFATYLWSEGATTQEITVLNPGMYIVTVQNANGCTAVDSFEVIMNTISQVGIDGSLAICPGGETVLSTVEMYTSYNWSTGSTDATIIANLPGIYAVTVTDENTCQSIAMVTVIEENELSITLLGDTEICEGETSLFELDGSYAIYEWSTGESTPTIEVGNTSEITVSVTDEFGCFGETSISLLVNELPIVGISGDEIFCDEMSSILDAGNFTTYEWQDSSTLSTIEVIETGTYSVTVTDDNGCVNDASIFVEELALPVPTILGAEAFCPQTITELSGEDGFVTYTWNTGEIAQNIFTNTIGTYILTVVDEFGCEGMNEITLVNFAIQDPQIIGIPNFCPDENTVLAVAQTFETYIWSNGGDTPINIVNTTGNITLEVVDENGCATSSAILVNEYLTSIPNISGPVGLCIGDITSLFAESGFVDYAWDTGNDSENLTVNAAGIYEVSVTDSNGCETNNNYELLEYSLPQVDILGSTTFCTDFFTTLSSSADFQEYLWSTGNTEANLQIGIEGEYILTVTDENGCQNNNNINIIEASELSPEITGPLFYCENESTTLDAGFGFATYTWSNNTADQMLTVTEPGTYSVSVTDIGGCAGEFEVLVVENPLPQPQIAGTLEFCVGEVTVLDVGNFYTDYVWGNGEETAIIIVDTPGDYQVVVSNEFGCEAADIVPVVERALPVFDIIGQDFFCENAFTNISVEPAFTNYTWTGGEDSQAINVDVPGEFGVTAVNEFGCTQFELINIAEISLPMANAGEAAVLDCEVRMLTLTAGIDNDLGYNYTYEWAGNGIIDNDVTAEFPEVGEEGLYTLIITDEDHNCISLPAEVNITDLAYQPEIMLEVFDTLDCTTASVRIEATVSITGNNIQYQWLDQNKVPFLGENNDFITVSNAEEYFFELIDELTHCMAEDSATVAENNLFPISNAGEPAHLDCITTTLNLDAAGSEEGANIIYEWLTITGNITANDNSLTPTINAPGLYQLIVSDTLNGCENISQVLVTQDIELPNVDAGDNQQLDCHTEIVSLSGSSNTAADGIAVGFEWHLLNSAVVLSTESTYEVAQSGTYNLVVTNLVNGCVEEDIVIVNLDDSFPTDMNLAFESPTCFGDANGVVLVENVEGGVQPLLYSLDGNAFSANTNFSNLPAGEYQVTVQDINGCEYATEVYLEDGNDLLLDLGEDLYIDLGETIDVNAYVNVEPDDLVSITWQSPAILNCEDENCLSFSTSPFLTTNYVVTVADENGCVRHEDITIYVNKPRDVFIPNVFSPNGDGTNEVAMIFAGKGVTIVKSFLIFNRWGEPVFEIFNFPPNDPNFGWDGHYRADSYNAAVFTYFAEVEFIDGEVILFKGDITLIK